MNLSSCFSSILPTWMTSFWSPAPTTAPTAPSVEQPRDVFERTGSDNGPARARMVDGLQNRAPRTPSLDRLLQSEATQRGTSLRGIELRFYDPQGIIAAYAMEPGFQDMACSDLFRYLLQTENFGPSCGETSAALKEVLFDGACTQSEGEDALYQTLRESDDTFVRVQIGCHSFIIEKRNDTCRVYQSYDSWYSLAQSLPDDNAIATEEFIASLQQVIRQDQVTTRRQARAASNAQERLFHGEVDATRNARGSNRYCINVETPERTTPQHALSSRFDTLLDRYGVTWNAFETAHDQSVLDFARTQWPAFFVG